MVPTNVCTLSATEMLYDLIYELNRYQWLIIGKGEMRWKDNGERAICDGYRLFYSRSADTHEHGVGFIVNSTVTNSVTAKQFQVELSPSV